MILGIFSDIHGNFDNLKTMRTQYESSVDRWVCLGDLANRGDRLIENEVIESVKHMNPLYIVKGNHDSRSYLTGGAISSENLDYVDTLPTFVGLEDLLAFHSSLIFRDRYLWSSLDIEEEYRGVKEVFGTYNLYLFGHTHMKAAYRKDDNSDSFVTLDHTKPILIKKDRCYFVNPGSLQPTFSDETPSFALYDTEERTLSFVSV